MAPRQIASTLLRFLEVLADLCMLSAYWLVCSLPILTLGAASSALYYTVVKVVRQEEGTLTRTFFSAFRGNLKQGLLPSLLFAAACSLIAAYWLLGEAISLDAGIFIAYWLLVVLLSILTIGVFSFVFPLIARFRQGTWAMLRSAFSLSLGYPLKTFGLVCLAAIAVWLLLRAPILMLLLPGVHALLSSLVLEPVFAKHMAKTTTPDAKR